MSKYDVFNVSATPPQSPAKKPEMIRVITRNVPEVVRAAAEQAMFPAVEAYMKDVLLPYWNGTEMEPHDNQCTVKGSGGGKGFVQTMCEQILKERIDISNRNLANLDKVSSTNRTKGDNKDKKERPKAEDAYVPVPPEDITPAGFQVLMKDAEEVGNEVVTLLLPEVDGLYLFLGTHLKCTANIRKMYDRKRIGAYRATDKGISGNPVGRANIITAGTENSIRKFFGQGGGMDIENGSVGRFCFTYMPRSEKRGQVVQGRYDQQWHDDVAVYINRLREARGVVELPKALTRNIERLRQELEEVSELSSHEIFEGWWHRSLEMAFMRACVLYIGQGYYGKVESEWVEWSLWHDLYSKVVLFMPQVKRLECGVDYTEVRRYGPVNMLDGLPDTFTKEDLAKVRTASGKDASPFALSIVLTNWKNRKYINQVEGSDAYRKTELYLAKHPNNN